MKIIFGLILSLGLSQVSLAQNRGGGWVKVYRSFNTQDADHFYTLDRNEGPRAGLRSEPNGNFLLARTYSREFSAALYRCLVVNNKGSYHFISTDEYCEGQRNEGLLGYAAADRRSTREAVVQLRRFVNGNDHVAALNTNFISNYQPEGVLGFVIASPGM